MGEFQLRITSQAARDLQEIVTYIARDNPALRCGPAVKRESFRETKRILEANSRPSEIRLLHSMSRMQSLMVRLLPWTRKDVRLFNCSKTSPKRRRHSFITRLICSVLLARTFKLYRSKNGRRSWKSCY